MICESDESSGRHPPHAYGSAIVRETKCSCTPPPAAAALPHPCQCVQQPVRTMTRTGSIGAGPQPLRTTTYVGTSCVTCGYSFDPFVTHKHNVTVCLPPAAHRCYEAAKRQGPRWRMVWIHSLPGVADLWRGVTWLPHAGCSLWYLRARQHGIWR